MVDSKHIQQVQGILDAYVQKFGQPESGEALEAIIGASIAAIDTLKLTKAEIEPLIQTVVLQFDPRVAAVRWLDVQFKLIAQKVYNWRIEKERTALSVLAAYVQQFAPNLLENQLVEVVKSIIPIIEDRWISKAEAKDLIHRVVSKFNLQKALIAPVEPKFWAIAEKVAYFSKHAKLEGTLLEVLDAYIQEFKPDITEFFIEQAIERIFSHSDRLDINVDIATEDRQLLIKQVAFKIQLVEPSPSPSKRAIEISRQIDQEVLRFKRWRNQQLGIFNAAMPTVLGELQVGIQLQERLEI